VRLLRPNTRAYRFQFSCFNLPALFAYVLECLKAAAGAHVMGYFHTQVTNVLVSDSYPALSFDDTAE